MIKSYTWIACLVFLFCFAACIDEISLDLDNDSTFIIVDGLVADTPGEYTVSLNQSPIIGVGNDNILTPITDASVTLKSDDGASFIFQELDSLPGSYQAFVELDNAVPYHLEVSLSDGTLIESTPQSVPPIKTVIEEVDFDVMEVELINESGNVGIQEFVELYISTPAINDEAYLRWRVKGEYQFIERYPRAFNPRNCYVKDKVDLNNVKIAKASDFQNGTLVDYPILRTVFNDKFSIVYLFNVFQYSINREEHEYWSKIEQLINIDGTLFDPPPGPVKGNLTNVTDPSKPVQGYFSITSVAFERFFAVPSRKGFFKDTDCTSNSFRPNPAKCADCTIISNSSLIKPPYWVF